MGSKQRRPAKDKRRLELQKKPSRRPARVRGVRQKKTEQALQTSEELYRLLAENATDVIARYSPEGVFLYVSPASRRILGYEPEELVGKSLYDFSHPADLEDLKRSHMGILETPVLRAVMHRFRTADDRYIWLETTAKAILDPTTGALMEIVATSRDASSRKIAEEALRTSERQFRQIAENIPQALWLSSADRHQILYANPAYEKIWGRSIQSLYEQPNTFFESIHPDDRLRIVGNHAQIGTVAIEEEFRVVHPDGSLRWVRSEVIPILDEKGQVTLLAGIAEDITRRAPADENLQRQ